MPGADTVGVGRGYAKRGFAVAIVAASLALPASAADADLLGVHTPDVPGVPDVGGPNVGGPAGQVVDDVVNRVNGVTDPVVPSEVPVPPPPGDSIAPPGTQQGDGPSAARTRQTARPKRVRAPPRAPLHAPPEGAASARPGSIGTQPRSAAPPPTMGRVSPRSSSRRSRRCR